MTAFQVRLLIPSDAETPEAAVDDFIGQVSEFGLRPYLYRVQNVETDEEFFVQHGQSMTRAEAEAFVAADDENETDETETPSDA